MSEPVYQSQIAIPFIWRQAWRVWWIILLVALMWLLSIIAAPLARSGGEEAIASPIFTLFGFICHQIPDRSPHLAGEPFAVCSRCFGIYFGLLFGVAIYPAWRAVYSIEPPRRIWLFAALIPVAVDASLTIFGIWENTHISRFVTGLILGFACATFIMPAIVEITRNLAHRRQSIADERP